MSKNRNLKDARKAKQDEFYTQLEDVEKEMNAYLEYNPDVFRDKTILLPCDDHEWSNFTRFFASHFQEYGIKKLISTSYSTQSSEEEQSYGRGKILIIDGTEDNSNRGEELEWSYLEGDGDFRSEEVTTLRDEADMVITNPPFSLFREFVQWLEEGGVEFSVIGSINAITYKEVFHLIKDNRIWIGARGMKSMTYQIPDTGELKGTQYRTDDGSCYQEVNTCWFTNIPHGLKNKTLPLMTMEENLRNNKRIINNPKSYKTYDNYDAIEVPVTLGIPSDYDGVMGVPISFLDKYNPDQFEIISGWNHGINVPNPGAKDTEYFDKSGNIKSWNGPTVDKSAVYFRILIKHKTQPEDE